MSIAKRLFKKYNHSSSVCIGLPGNKDPQQFKVRTPTAAAAATSRWLNQPDQYSNTLVPSMLRTC
jgi:hypothetical protein